MRDVRLPEYPTTLSLEVWFRDIDALGHVSTGVFMSYFEQARVLYWRSLLEGAPEEERDFKRFGFMFVKAELEFASPAILGEKLLVGCRVSALRGKSFSFAYSAVAVVTGRPGAVLRPVASGRTVQVFFDFTRGQSLTIPESLRRRIAVREGDSLRTPGRGTEA